MKKELFTLLLSLFFLPLSAQDFEIVSVESLPADMSAREEMKTDHNDRQCALLRVATQNITPEQREKFIFKSDLGSEVVERASRIGEIWLWVSPNLKYLRIMHPDWGQYELRLIDHVASIDALQTYKITVKGNLLLSSQEQNNNMPTQQPAITPTQSIAKKKAPKGAIDGVFSINPNQKVYFSKGNLQYQASTREWRFAEKQWEYIGGGNRNISRSYNGWIDLFGWGTGGNPTATSTTYIDSYSEFIDWGKKYGNNWYTLSYSEWKYVINERKTVSGMRFVKANVSGVCGLVLLPDDWNSSIYPLNDPNQSKASYDTNTISDIQWVELEQHGAVFLPAAGTRTEKSCSSNGIAGCYWSASEFNYNGYNAFRMSFSDKGMSLDSKYSYYSYSESSTGCSVRLVHDN